MPHYTNIGSLTKEIWRLIDFSRWRPLWRDFTSVFGLSNVTLVRRLKSIYMMFCLKLLNFISDHPIQKYDVIQIFEDGGRGWWVLVPVCFCWCHCLQKIKVYQQTKFRRHISIHGSDITTSVFRKTNVRHIWILLPISISVKSPQSACYFALGCRISSKSDHLLPKHDIISIFFQDGGRGGSILLPVSHLLMPLY